MLTLSSSVRSELSASASLVDVSLASAQCEGEGFDEESASLVSPAVHEKHVERREEANDKYEDDGFEDDVDRSSDSRLQVLVGIADSSSAREDDDYSGDLFEEQDEEPCSSADVDTREIPLRNKAGGEPPEDGRAFESYGEESFEIDEDDASVQLRCVDGDQADERELEWMAKEDRDVEAQEDTMDSPTLSLRNKWCTDKIQALTSRKARLERASLSTAVSAHSLPKEACLALQSQLLRMSKQIPGIEGSSSRTPGSRRLSSSNHAIASHLPSEFFEKMQSNAKTKRLLHTTFDTMVSSESEPEREHTAARGALTTHQKYLITFYVVKRADLEGKLATICFEDRWSHSYTNHTSETEDMSIGSLEILQGMMAKQREILHLGTATTSNTGNADGTLFSCMQTRAPNLDLTVASTQRCLNESRMLREQASRLLRPHSQTQTTTAD